MKKRIYLVLETEADEDDKSILNDIEQELGMATHYFETCSYSEIGFEGLWRSTFEQPPKKEDADENGYVMAIALCRTHHNEAHSREKEFFEENHIYGIKLDETLCERLNLRK